MSASSPASTINPIPDGYRRINAALVVDDGARAIDFYGRVFGAVERSLFPGPGGSILHAELVVGDSIIMLEDASEMMGTQAPPREGLAGSPAYLYVYVDDVDAAVERAVGLGATLKRPVTDQFYGDRDGFVVDPFGHGWVIASHREDVAPAEMARRLNSMTEQA